MSHLRSRTGLRSAASGSARVARPEVMRPGGGRRPFRAVALVLLLVTALGACGRGSATEGVSAGKLDELAAARAVESRSFEWSATVARRTVTVRGVVEDDYRYQGTVLINDAPVWEEVVVDDTRYLRIVDPGAVLEAELVAEIAAASPAGASLMSGAWVRDIRAAPREFGERAQQIPLDPQLVLNASRRLDRVPELLRLGGFAKYNKFAASYLPKNDKFPEHTDDGVRFDHIPAAFDANRIFTKLDDARRYFEFASVWADLDGLNRIERLVELPNPADDRYFELYDQLERAGDRRLVVLLDAITKNAADKDLRRLTETYTVEPDPAVVVAAPSEHVDGDLLGLITLLRERIGSRPDPTALFGPLE